MYNFSLETLLYFARIRQLKGAFRSAAFYGFGDIYDPCVIMITVQSGSMLSCTIYNRYSQIIEITEAMMNVLHHSVVEWTFEDATPGYTHGHASSFDNPSAPSSPNWRQQTPPPSSPNWRQQTPPPGSQMGYPQYQRMSPLNGVRNPQHTDHFQTDALSYSPAPRNTTGPFTFTTEPHYPVSPNNTGPQRDSFLTLVPLRLKAVPRSEVLQWKGNIKSIYMRTNGINTITQIATMLSLPAADVLQILQQLEKEGLISLRSV
jgi:hypothetical protein